MFSTVFKRENVILAMSNMSSANAFNLVMSKILLFGKGLNYQRRKESDNILGNLD